MDNSIKLNTYVRLGDIMEITKKQLIKNNAVIGGNEIKNYTNNKQDILTFNSLIATGNHVINILNDESLIKTNFGNNDKEGNILLQFDTRLI